MIDKLEMPLEQFAEAVAKENVRLNEHNEKLKEQTKLYFQAFNKATNHIEKLEAALRNVAVTLDSEEIPYMVRNRHACATAKEALEGNPEKSVYKEGYRAVEEAMGHPSPEFWVERKYDI
jgi:exonuclease VII large subunit